MDVLLVLRELQRVAEVLVKQVGGSKLNGGAVNVHGGPVRWALAHVGRGGFVGAAVPQVKG